MESRGYVSEASLADSPTHRRGLGSRGRILLAGSMTPFCSGGRAGGVAGLLLLGVFLYAMTARAGMPNGDGRRRGEAEGLATIGEAMPEDQTRCPAATDAWAMRGGPYRTGGRRRRPEAERPQHSG